VPRHSSGIKVMHLIGSTGLYGAERWVLAVMRAMDAASVSSTLVNLVDGEGGGSEVVVAARARGLEAFDFNTGGKFNLLAALQLARLARSLGVQIIHGHGFKSDMLGLLGARVSGCKAVTTPHGWSFEKDKKLLLYERLDRALFPFMDLVCPLSPELTAQIAGSCPKRKIRYICNGVDLEELDAIPAAKGEGVSGFSIGYVGQLIERKDLPTLLAAVKLLARDNATFSLTVVGDGTKFPFLLEEAERLGIAGRVSFTGFRSDAAALLKTFDAFVLPSLMEGIPRCIMEAMACGVPVVVTDIPGNRDLVETEQTGLLFAPGDSEGLARQLRRLMADRDFAKEMARRARRKIETHFSSRSMAQSYTGLYRELVARPA
jgi:glycosyltransferase involved in cell wall biosynthesis